MSDLAPAPRAGGLAGIIGAASGLGLAAARKPTGRGLDVRPVDKTYRLLTPANVGEDRPARSRGHAAWRDRLAATMAQGA